MLTQYWRTIEEEEEDKKICIEREKKLRYKVESLFPADVDGQVSYQDIGKGCIRAFIYLPLNAPKENTERCKHFLVTLCGEAKRDFRAEEGTFMWKGSKTAFDENGEYEELVFVENVHPGNCKIKSVQKTVTVFETDCKQEG